MPIDILDIKPRELSLIFGEYKGEVWSPVNPDARVLSVKGAPLRLNNQRTGAKGDNPAWLAKAEAAVKAAGKDPKQVLKGWYTDGPVVDQDNAGEYNSLVTLIMTMYWDLSSASYISDDEGRSVAVVAILENFLEELDKVRADGTTGESGKAGKRHSASDQKAIDAAAAAHAKVTAALEAAKNHAATIGDSLSKLGTSGESGETKATTVVDASLANPVISVGEPNGDGIAATIEVKAKTQEAADTALSSFTDKSKTEGDYGTDEQAGYADKGWQSDGKPRYPTKKGGKLSEERIKAAWGYINQSDNADKYSSDDLAKVKANIKAAAKEAGVTIDEEKAASVNAPPAPSTIDQASIDAAIAKAVSSAQSELRSELEEKFKATIDESKSKIETLEGQLTEARSIADEAKGQIKAMVDEARTPTSSGFTPTRKGDGTVKDPADPDGEIAREKRQEALKGAKTIADVITLQREATT